jgi:hypothetical protein
MMELDLLSYKSLGDEKNHIGCIWSPIELIMMKVVEYATSIDHNITLTKGTWGKFLQVLQKVITVIFCLESGDDGWKRYRLMEEQQPLFNSARNDHGNQQTDVFYLNLVFSLPRQRIVNDSYECVFLSTLAVMSIKRDATYMPPNDLTTLFAALIASFCALIFSAAQNYPVKCCFVDGRDEATIEPLATLHFSGRLEQNCRRSLAQDLPDQFGAAQSAAPPLQLRSQGQPQLPHRW